MYYRSERRGNTSFYDRVELTREEVDAKYERYRARVMEKGPWKGTLSGPWYDDSDLIVYGQTEEEAWRLIRDHLTEMREEIDKTLATLEPVSTSSQEAVKGVTTR